MRERQREGRRLAASGIRVRIGSVVEDPVIGVDSTGSAMYVACCTLLA